MNGICAYCLLPGKLVDSHIIPKAVCIAPGATEPARIISDIDYFYPKRSHTGIYDQFLCSEHEQKFALWDDYGAKMLLSDGWRPILIKDAWGSELGYQLPNVDYIKLKLFFLSVLWRASVAKHDFFSAVNLGPHEEKIFAALKSNDPGDWDFLPVGVGLFNILRGAVMLNPHTTRHESTGINHVMLYLENFTLIFKVDSRPLPADDEPLFFHRDQPLTILKQAFKNSRELPIIMKLARGNRKYFNK